MQRETNIFGFRQASSAEIGFSDFLWNIHECPKPRTNSTYGMVFPISSSISMKLPRSASSMIRLYTSGAMDTTTRPSHSIHMSVATVNLKASTSSEKSTFIPPFDGFHGK